MLKINLLPPEYRKSDGTPIGVLMIILLCTFLSVSSFCCVAWFYFSLLENAQNDMDIAKQEMDNLAPLAKYADNLEKEKTEYMKRSSVITDIETTRILWTKKLDQILDVINNNGDTTNHYVWLDELKINMNGRGKDTGYMKMKGSSVGDQIKQVSSFNRDLRNHELFENDFEKISNPTGESVTDDKMNPSKSIQFDWELTLRDKSTQNKKK